MSTDYHAKYWAAIIKVQDKTDESIEGAIGSARVDLNPHQVEAAAFALRSPLSNGVVLADEVGLGKTIEAGLVLLQLWSRRKRRLLIVAPATLRRQWATELTEKFGLPATVLDKDGYAGNGRRNPFDDERHVLVCSYHFAAQHAADVRQVPWDRVVFDEAHQLRNVWKAGSQRAKTLADATRSVPKLLLTATPLQNSLMELYGLVSIIDQHVFGDQRSFQSLYASSAAEDTALSGLKSRLAPLVKRTLRRQVQEYVKFTSRIPITQDFTPAADEQALYEMVSEYLQREDSYALPKAQRTLMTLILRKILASSSQAIGSTLQGMAKRLEEGAAEAGLELAAELEIDEDYDGDLDDPRSPAVTADDVPGIRAEARQLRDFADLAFSIGEDAKATALLDALPTAFTQATSRGAQEKAVIFTESVRTQHYLVGLLEHAGYAGCVLTINGVNKEPLSQELYSAWRKRRLGEGKAVGNRASDVKSAIVEAFRGDYSILVATEAAAEGLNLQFCSLVVNYDLPWNPQRIEQRIGRCHRYGQKHDVVVLNFLNRSNAADQRVYELLAEKFKLFDGVFGASDEVLGALASGFDLERRIGEVYQQARTEDEIEAEFAKLRADLEADIEARMASTRATLLEDFDEEVADRLRVEEGRTKRALDARQAALWNLTRHELSQWPAADVDFSEELLAFKIDAGAGLDAHLGRHALMWREADSDGADFYHAGSPLAHELLKVAEARVLPEERLVIDYTGYGRSVGALAGLRGQSGVLAVHVATVTSADDAARLLLVGRTDAGARMDPEQIARLLDLGRATNKAPSPWEASAALVLEEDVTEALEAFKKDQHERLDTLLEEESDRLNEWADDLKRGLEVELKELDKQLKEARRATRTTAGMGTSDRLRAQRAYQEVERKRKAKRREIEAQEDEIAARRDAMLDDVEARLAATFDLEELFAVRWELE